MLTAPLKLFRHIFLAYFTESRVGRFPAYVVGICLSLLLYNGIVALVKILRPGYLRPTSQVQACPENFSPASTFGDYILAGLEFLF